LKKFLMLLVAIVLFATPGISVGAEPTPGHVAIIAMDMAILPGTSEYLKESVQKATVAGAKIAVVTLDTPGGLLDTTQEITQFMFKSPIPIVIYVSPSGSTATSAGVFITMAAHVAAMAPGTSIGAAHPVTGEGKDIEGDMRAKAENATVSMAKTLAEQRGRNADWVEKAVKSSESITEKEAVKLKVVDLIAEDVGDLLRKMKGREVKLEHETVTLGDYSSLPQVNYEISFRQKAINVLANPNVAALLWLGATTGFSIELYNPGLILPGVVGAVCLVLALAVSQVIPISEGAVALLVLGSLLIGLELFIPSGILGVGGVIAIVLGAIYLVDVSQAPGLSVSLPLVAGIAGAIGLALLYIVMTAVRVLRQPATTGNEGLVGQRARVYQNFSGRGTVFVNGETWAAELAEGIAEKDSFVVVLSVKPGLVLEVKKES
jgi:membrane-bound serine protease (ClpP class)